MNQVVENIERDNSLKTIGHISYLLHTIVAVGAVLPGVQAAQAVQVQHVRGRIGELGV